MSTKTETEETRYITEERVSEITGFAKQTLGNHRFNRVGIPYYKIGRSVRYRVDEVYEFMNRHRIAPEG